MNYMATEIIDQDVKKLIGGRLRVCEAGKAGDEYVSS